MEGIARRQVDRPHLPLNMLCNASGLFQAVAALCRTHMSSQCAPAGIRVTTISEYVCIVRETAIVVAEINDA